MIDHPHDCDSATADGQNHHCCCYCCSGRSQNRHGGNCFRRRNCCRHHAVALFVVNRQGHCRPDASGWPCLINDPPLGSFPPPARMCGSGGQRDSVYRTAHTDESRRVVRRCIDLIAPPAREALAGARQKKKAEGQQKGDADRQQQTMALEKALPNTPAMAVNHHPQSDPRAPCERRALPSL